MSNQSPSKPATQVGFVRKGVLGTALRAGDISYMQLPDQRYVVICPVWQDHCVLGLLVLLQQKHQLFEPVLYGTSPRLQEIAWALDGLMDRLSAQQLCFTPWQQMAWRNMPAWLWPVVTFIQNQVYADPSVPDHWEGSDEIPSYDVKKG